MSVRGLNHADTPCSELSTALDCFIECANLGLRSWGGAERNAVAPVRGGLLGTVRLGRGVL